MSFPIKYPKIQTVFQRDPETNYKTLLDGHYSTPELHYLLGNQLPILMTEKVDGTNIRVCRDQDDNSVQFRGRTDKAQIPKPLYNKLQELFDPFPELFEQGKQVILFGEGYGNRIQKGGDKYISDDVDFVLFDVWVDGTWLQRDAVEQIAQSLGVKVAPLVFPTDNRSTATFFSSVDDLGTFHTWYGYATVQDAIKLCSEGFNSHWGGFRAEGVVIKPLHMLLDRQRSPIITKLKCSDYDH